MYRLFIRFIVFVIIAGCTLYIAAWFDIATSFCALEHRSGIFNIKVSRAIWWLTFITGFGPLTLLYILYQQGVLTTK